MVLLLGGTSESVEIARALTNAGHPVLFSQATEMGMILPQTPLFTLRRGRLDRDGLARLARQRGIRAVVDASHPFATALHDEVAAMCANEKLPLLRFERPGPALPAEAIVAVDHRAAARAAFGLGKVVLLTTGSRHLTEYVQAARACGGALWARVAPSVESAGAVDEAGLLPQRVEWAKGPFTMRDTLDLLEKSAAEVLVTKDSGVSGGLVEKFEAARHRGVRVVVVARPASSAEAVATVADVLGWLPDSPHGRDIPGLDGN